MQTDPGINVQGKPRVWAWTGASFEPGEAVPATDRGFRYGMSVFESFPVRNGIGIFLNAHLEKLREACQMTGLAAPPGALDECARLLKQSGNGFARIYVTAGDGPVTAACDNCRLLILIEPRDEIPAHVYHRGYDLHLHPGIHLPLFAGLKTGNYWSNLIAFREGVAAHCNETLLFSRAGHLISACMANVFIVKDGRVRTPGPGTGARSGVTRAWVQRQVDVEETLFTRAETAGADEIFLTSSWLGIMPAASLAGRPLKDRAVSTRLLEAYRNQVHGKPE
jgi:branched-subunit amino acid aminotransferase/4-amino-4-deoxychorismate lyase